MHKAKIKLLVLHEHELRKAAKLLEAMLDAQGTDDFPEAAQAAMNACIVALHGMADEESSPIVMVSNTERLVGDLTANSN